MGVTPGKQGNPFKAEVLTKVDQIKQQYPEAIIEIDGGVSTQTIRSVVSSGLNRLVVGSALLNSENPKNEYQKLMELGRTSLPTE
jgi:pentose-5-phosphate-3-epimerase